jgi:hypothetical protein
MTTNDLPAVRFYKVHLPRPVIYTFSPINLAGFVWAKDFDKLEGKYASNQRKVIRKCIGLRFVAHQREPVVVNTDNELSINQDTLGGIAFHHALHRDDKSFKTSDMRLFFEQYTNDLNEAERWADTELKAWFSARVSPGTPIIHRQRL